MPSRRELLQLGAMILSPTQGWAQSRPMPGMAPPASDVRPSAVGAGQLAPDHRLDIATSVIELGKNAKVSTRTYNGQFPGPLLRFTEGQPAIVEVRNRTRTAEVVHWHGQHLNPAEDGAVEEGTPLIPAGGTRRIAFTPNPAGFRFYHTHTTAGLDLTKGFYSGQAGPVYIAARNEPGRHDREVFLTLKEFGPYLSDVEMSSGFLSPKNRVQQLFDIDQTAIGAMRKRGKDPGHQISYRYYSINGRMLGEGEPIRVQARERVLFHVLNASATETRSLSLPGHTFNVIALDGNPVPRPAPVPVLWLGPGERISATVDMTAPGVWVMGDRDDMAREGGMGVVVEYAGSVGPAVWKKPAPSDWDYRRFANPNAVAQRPDEAIELIFGTRYNVRRGFDEFTINGMTFSMTGMAPRFPLAYGRRYRLIMRNATDDIHPIHLHRHSFELTSVAGFRTAGIIKDVVMIGAFQEMSVDFTANQKGPSLFHCHMQPHMDFGFMALFDCV